MHGRSAHKGMVAALALFGAHRTGCCAVLPSIMRQLCGTAIAIIYWVFSFLIGQNLFDQVTPLCPGFAGSHDLNNPDTRSDLPFFAV